MKRIKAACLEQTLHFYNPDSTSFRTPEYEYKAYLKRLERSNTAYKIISEEKQEDGSLIIKLKKQYNDYPYGEYLD